METNKGQSLRGSQYITTFGPGSILETPDGPVVIAAISHSQLFKERKPEDFEITDLRLSKTLLFNGKIGKIFRIPSNAELGLNENQVVYHAYHFPLWSLCTTHGILYCYDFQKNIGCPECAKENTQSSKDKVRLKSRQEAIRFVLACSAGHLDEVPWLSIIKHKSNCSKPNYLKWQGAGEALSNVNLICPECGKSVNLKQIYYNIKVGCPGRFPEENKRKVECKKYAKIIQRGAANLRIVEIKSALTIPPLDTGLHRLLQTSTILDSIVSSVVDIDSQDILFQMLDKLVNAQRLDKEIASKIKKYPETEILQAIQDILEEITSPKEPKEETLRKDEFKSLRKAATEGAPPQKANRPGGPNQFEVYKENVKLFRLASGRILRVTPLSRLRVVVVQVGYTRPIETNNDENYSNFSVVPIEYVSENIGWYPGVELFGEGIFIDFVSEQETTGVSQHFELKGKAAESWLKAYNVVDNYRKLLNIPGMHKNYLHPVFVWWHTLSHRLIKSLSIDSGYSSAAIRERVYTVNIAEKVVGGLLLYTAQSGGDGTLGGLIGLVPHFDRILQLALRDIHTCSNDPICIEENFAEDKVNGSACYACQFISETSCEHRNTLLDRKLLLENLP